ncbi:hypothetical protein [uncultured Roseibium sp.]|uniref:hypothetical protein n=1 Tax=uncultured Roseibium sp. TaxID=1936171 RepID=UPI00321704E4
MITSAVGVPLLTGYAIGATVFFLLSLFELAKHHGLKPAVILATLGCAGIWPVAIVIVLLIGPKRLAS